MNLKFVGVLTLAAAATVGLGALTWALPARADVPAGCNAGSDCYISGPGWGGCEGQDALNCLCMVGNDPGVPDGKDCGAPSGN